MSSPQAATFVRLFVVSIYGLPMLIGVWWLVLFNRKGIARQFQAQPIMMEHGVTPVPVKPACPLPLAILAGFFLLTACYFPLLFLMPYRTPVVLFGHVFSGPTGSAIYVLMSLVLGVTGIGLLQLRRWSYPLLFAYQLFSIANLTALIVVPSARTAAIDRVMAKIPASGVSFPFQNSATFFNGVLIACLIFVLAILAIALYYRQAFYEQSDRKRDLEMSSPNTFPPQSPQNATS